MKVALTGAGGFVGSHLRDEFSDYVIIKRSDDEKQILEKLQDVDVVFNLAGAPIIKRWSVAYKKVLLSSRIETTKKLVNAINKSDVKYFISASAIGAYPSDKAYDESFEGYSDDFLGTLTKMWEAEAKKCNKPTSIVRFGIVLGKDGGALKQMLAPFKMGVGGIIADGRAMMSWIDIDELVDIYSYLYQNKLTGTFNATAPNPLCNHEFTKTLGMLLHRPTVVPLPALILKLLFGEGASVLTDSKEVYPKALIDAGFTFKYKTLKESFEHIFA
jgi:hypothetical protein